jgi:archaeal cell division control protein 6
MHLLAFCFKKKQHIEKENVAGANKIKIPSHQSLFKDESKLDINFTPQSLPHREKEQRLLTEFFSFILKCPDRMAQRVILTGEVGTGKTALAQRFGADLTSNANKRNIKVRYLHVNCREFRGSLVPILAHAVTSFYPNFPVRGYSAEEILKGLLQVLDDDQITLILTLDEFDSLIEKEGSDAVYKLTRVQEMRQGRPQRLSFIFIMRDLKAIEHLDESARSTLQRSIIHLERYGKTQLIDILNDRVSMAFEFGAVEEDVVDLIAELAFKETGNARFGIELLWRAGKYADAEDLERIIAECVRTAASNIIPSMRKSDLATLGLHEKLFLLAVARYFKENQEAIASLRDIETTYGVLCEEFNEKPSAHTQVWMYAQFLSSIGILKTEVSSSHGRTTKVSLLSIPAVELEKELTINIENEKRTM